MTVARHTLYNLAGQSVPLLVSLATVPLYLWIVGIERYGLLAICWTLVGFASFVGLGLGPAITRELARIADSSAEERGAVFWTGFWASLGLSGFGFFLLFSAATLYFKSIVLGPDLPETEIREALPWLSLVFALGLSASFVSGALQGRRWFGVLNIIQSASTIGLGILPLVAAILFGPTLRHLLIATLVVHILAFVALFTACTRAVPLRRPLGMTAGLARRLISYGGWMTLVAFLAPVVMLIDRFVIGSLIGPAAVSVYVIAYNLVSRIVMIPASLHAAVLPRLAAVDYREQERLKDISLGTLVASMTPVCVAGCILLPPFLHLWLGRNIGLAAAPLAGVLVVGFWAHGISHVASGVLMARGRPDMVSKLLLAYVLPYSGVLWVAVLQFGLLGAAIAWSVRACFDFVLFAFVGLGRRQVVSIALAGACVVATSVATILLDWRSFSYWAVASVLAAVAVSVAIGFAPEAVRAHRAGAWLFSRVPDRLLRQRTPHP